MNVTASSGYHRGMNRRTVMAGAGASLLAAAPSFAKSKTPDAPVRLGLIGAGSRGQELARHFGRLPGVSLVAACDVYEPRFAQLEKLTKQPFGRYVDHRALLERKDLDAVVVATPLYLHANHVTAALNSGRHVYGEKSMGLSLDHCNAILKAATSSRRLFQIGHQFRYAPWYQEALRRVHAGEIGKVTHIDAYWHRNHDWRRFIPGTSQKPDAKLDRLINWRLYREYSGGLMAELGSHAIDLANWVFGGTPASVIGSGGIDHWRDGREVNDNVKAIFRYPEGGSFTFSSITSNAHQGYQQWIYGTLGSVQLTLDSATIYRERSAPLPATRAETKAADAVTGASYLSTGENPGAHVVSEIWRPRDGLESDVTYLACRAFITSLRKHETPFADAHVGWASGISAALANQAIDAGKQMAFDAKSKPA